MREEADVDLGVVSIVTWILHITLSVDCLDFAPGEKIVVAVSIVNYFLCFKVSDLKMCFRSSL